MFYFNLSLAFARRLQPFQFFSISFLIRAVGWAEREQDNLT